MTIQMKGGITTVSAAFFNAVSLGPLIGSGRSQTEQR
jgi:hypothetical protein